MRMKKGPLDLAREVMDKLANSFSKKIEREVRL